MNHSEDRQLPKLAGRWSVKTKILAAMLLVSLSMAIILSAFVLQQFHDSLIDDSRQHLESMLELQRERINEFVSHVTGSAEIIASNLELQGLLAAYNYTENADSRENCKTGWNGLFNFSQIF